MYEGANSNSKNPFNQTSSTIYSQQSANNYQNINYQQPSVHGNINNAQYSNPNNFRQTNNNNSMQMNYSMHMNNSTMQMNAHQNQTPYTTFGQAKHP
jgi:hypothetical protein